MIRVLLPTHLRQIARVTGEVRLDCAGATFHALIDRIEELYPMLSGTIRDYASQQRRPFLRFFASQEDLSHLGLDHPLPAEVLAGTEPLIILAAVAGG